MCRKIVFSPILGDETQFPFYNVFQVELTWTMASLLHLYKSKPHQYVSWIIGHEGKGSLISYLRKKMWCLDVFSGNGESGFEHSSMYALFSLTLVLTDEGHRCLKEVLDAVFSYINLVRREGPQKRIYDEIHKIEETNFRYKHFSAILTFSGSIFCAGPDHMGLFGGGKMKKFWNTLQ